MIPLHRHFDKKIIIPVLVFNLLLIIIGGIFFIFKNTNQSPVSQSVQPNQETQNNSANEWTDLIKYNCELSGGTFNNGQCNCPAEEEISETGGEPAYDKSTGFCQTTYGGPGGNAFNASVGLPWGEFSFWTRVISSQCVESGGTWLNARCTCPDETVYSRSSGICE